MPGMLHCPAVLRSCSAQSGSVSHVIRFNVFMLHGIRLFFNYLMHFKLQKCSYFMKYKDSCYNDIKVILCKD
jgi:hypothetical protein